MDPKKYTKARKWVGCTAQCLSLKKKAPNQSNRPILVGEMVQNNQKIVFYAILGHLGTPKWTQKGTQRSASGQDVWPNVLA
jgi:hypothetical protein